MAPGRRRALRARGAVEKGAGRPARLLHSREALPYGWATMNTVLLFVGAALAEIAGCFAFWAWQRLGAPFWWVVPGLASLGACAYLLTRVDSDAAGRAYAAFGAVYIGASMLWLWAVEGRQPTRWDLIGAAVCLAGAGLILHGASARPPG
jgi:small multidrug resistance family-3 protein